MAPYRAVDADDVEPAFGVFRKVRQALDVEGFGINQVELPPGAAGREHDERESGQQEVYLVLAGAGVMNIDGEEVALQAGRYLLVEPHATRMPVAGPDGLTFVAVGGVPGGKFSPRQNL